ncbi:hypothetical protein BSU04_04400 [Caballeronia sordidicola]|uniref:Uncharacterized protein n=1 Tax=Caballeronia sordidicola TaxID=196367 RepID=A0A226XB27_CABSO|nr:hypothetical protein BSU04_04400 [Caballeronia sordidicola]
MPRVANEMKSRMLTQEMRIVRNVWEGAGTFRLQGKGRARDLLV